MCVNTPKREKGSRRLSVLRRDTLSAMQADIRSVDLRVRLRPAEADKLRELAAKDDEPVSAVVRRAIRRYVEQVDQDGGA